MEPLHTDLSGFLELLQSGASKASFGRPRHPPLTCQQLVQLAVAMTNNTGLSSLDICCGKDVGLALATLEVLKQTQHVQSLFFDVDDALPLSDADEITTATIDMLRQSTSLKFFEAEYMCHNALAPAIPKGIVQNNTLQSIDIAFHSQDVTLFEYLIDIVRAIGRSSLHHVRIGYSFSPHLHWEDEKRESRAVLQDVVIAFEGNLQNESQLRSFVCHLNRGPGHYEELADYLQNDAVLYESSVSNAVNRSRLRDLRCFGLERLPEVRKALENTNRRNRIISLSTMGNQIFGHSLSGEELFVFEPPCCQCDEHVSLGSPLDSLCGACLRNRVAYELQQLSHTVCLFSDGQLVCGEVLFSDLPSLTVQVAEDLGSEL